MKNIEQKYLNRKRFILYGDDEAFSNEKAMKKVCENFYEHKEYSRDFKISVILEYPKVKSNINNQTKNIIKKLFSNGVKPSDIVISINNKNSQFSIEDWNSIKKLEEKAKKCGITIGVEDYGKTWDLKDVENSNIQIEKTANSIKSQKLSPIEKLMSAYINITSKKYLQEENYEHVAQSRSIYGVLNGDKIVCVGYANLLKSMMEQISDENVKIFVNIVNCKSDEGDVYHANNIVRIKDEKYGINGYYYLDPTWDSSTDEVRLNHFLIPISDIKEISLIDIKSFYNDTEEQENNDEYDNVTNKRLQKKEEYISSGWYTENGKVRYKHLDMFLGENQLSLFKNGIDINEEFNKFIEKDPLFKKAVKESYNESIEKYFNKNVGIVENRYLKCMKLKKHFEENNLHFISHLDMMLFLTISHSEKIKIDLDKYYINSFIDKYKFDKQDVIDKLKNIIDELVPNSKMSKRIYNKIINFGDRIDKKGENFYERLHIQLMQDEQTVISKFKKLVSIKNSDKNFEDVLFELELSNIDTKLYETLNKLDKKYIEEISSYKQLNQAFNQIGDEKGIENYLWLNKDKYFDVLEKISEPIPINVINSALYEVIRQNNKDKEKEVVYEVTSNIIKDNIEDAKNYFNRNAKNCFALAYYFDKTKEKPTYSEILDK